MKNLLDICLELHQANMGSHEPDVSTTEYKFQYNILRNKIKEWKKPHYSSELFDSAVASLILATIRECELTNHKILGDTEKKIQS